MKAITLTIATILTITVVSCRQSEDVLITEEMKSNNVLQINKNEIKEEPTPSFKKDSINENGEIVVTIDGEIVPPPRK